MQNTEGSADAQAASYVALYAEGKSTSSDQNTSVREHMASFLRVSYDDKEVMLEGDQRKVYGDGVGHLWFMKDGFIASYVEAGYGHITEREINKALHELGIGRAVLRIKNKTYRIWKTTDTSFPHLDGHERRNVAGERMLAPGGLPTVGRQTPLGTLTAQVNEDWEVEAWDKKVDGAETTTYVNVRTGETREVTKAGLALGIGSKPPVGGFFMNPKHSAKRQAWDCINHEAEWLPASFFDKFQKARDAGLSLEHLWLVLEDLVEKIERIATYNEPDMARDGWAMSMQILDAKEFLAKPRWGDQEPEFSSAKQLTGRHPVPQLEPGPRHSLAEIKEALARGNPMYASPRLPPPEA